MRLRPATIFELDYGYRGDVPYRTPRPPHEFVPSQGSIRKLGAPMRNPPAPSDFMPNPMCATCRRYRKDEIHDLVSNHDFGDEDRT